MNIHYNPTTGEIVGYDTIKFGQLPQVIPGCAVLQLEIDVATINTATHKVADGQVVTKSASETLFANLPSEFEVRGARHNELQATDYTDAAVHLHARQRRGEKLKDLGPIEPHLLRSNWQKYRQALRDLGELTNPVEMIMAWPLRPDGHDAIPHLRARI